uniref:Uncharacterized protein n=1 Tax=Plectus sambesii TaxID=2011161 RepID=A0A914VEN7_9BILA
MNFNFTCDAVVRGEENAVRIAKKWQYQSEFKNASQLLDLMDDCSTFKSRFSFPSVTLSAEEADFPLAYGLIVYKNPEQVVRMLSSIYWPQNLYCITYDTKSTQLFKDILNKLPKCFPNVLIPKEKYKIDWCGYGVLQVDRLMT